MIIVTGLPRSGTSLMMRILESLSIPITGEEFFESKDEDRKERVKYLNPEGFHEIRGSVATGLFKEPEKFTGQAVKVVVPGVVRVPLQYIEKIIFCLRDPSEVIESQRNLISNVEVATLEGKKYSHELLQRSFNNYIRQMGILILNSDDNFWNKTIVVEYKNLIVDHTHEIQKISDFLNVSFVDKDLVKDNLYRSKPVIESDPLAFRIYESIKTKDFLTLKLELKEWFDYQNFLNTQWVDEEEFGTFALSNLSLHKSFVSNNKGIRDKLLQSSKKVKHYFDCSCYSRNGEEYIIRRPEELPDLIRKKVTCSHHKKEVTVEFCHQCFVSLCIKKVMEMNKS